VAEAWTLYRRLVGARIRSDFQYRLSFALFFLGQLLITFLDFVAIAVLFGQVHQLAGWSLAEVAVLYGLTGTSFALADMFIGTVDNVAVKIRDGTFDGYLIRPLGPLLQLVTDEFAPRRIGKVVQAAVILGIALGAAHVRWTAGRVAMLPLTILGGTVIFSAVWVVTACIAFWTVDSGEAANAFTYGGNFMTQYPLGVYGAWLRRLLAYLVPLAFVNYFPAVYLLGRRDLLGAPSITRFASPFIAILTVFVARAVWTEAVRHYRSTGS
jgi:ABC-2 type transport system permease protein